MNDFCTRDINRRNEMVEQVSSSRALGESFAKIDSGELELTGDGGLIPPD